jgi:beta-galactosidase
MFIKNENPNPPQKNIRIIKSDKASSFAVDKVSEPITGKFWAEGPTSIRIGEYIYVYFDKYRDHKYGAIRSKDMKNWEDISEEISFPKGLRHGTVFKVSEVVFERLKKK